MNQLSRPGKRSTPIAAVLAGSAFTLVLAIGLLRGSQDPAVTRTTVVPARDQSTGVVDHPSKHSVEKTVTRLRELLEAREVTLFAEIDHSGEAAKAGLTMRPARLVIFGNPKAGTPMMIAAPRLALDLPLKLLVWEDAEGKTWISYSSAAYLRERHGLTVEQAAPLEGVAALAVSAGS